MRMRIRPSVTVLFVAVLGLLLLGLMPSAVSQNSGKQQICHRTGSSSNPRVGIEPSNNAKGHSTHPEKNGNNDGQGGSGWSKGPSVRGGGGGCDGGGGNGGNPPPTNGNGNGGGGGGGGFAAPAEAVAGQPTVTG
jgi:hypothetical protein